MSSKDEILAKFIEVSGCEEKVAEFYLSGANWSLEVAMSSYLASQNDSDDQTSASDRPATTEAATDFGPKPASPKENFQKSSSRPRFGTLNDMSKKSSNNSDEEEGQAFYAGGSDRSGQQVLGPPKRKNFKEQLADMFRMAQEHGSHETEPMPSSSSAAAAWGQGIRLGMTDTDHSVVKSSTDKSTEKKPIVILKLWSEGFSVDDGELRHYDDPDNKEFLETVMRGEIPQELLDRGWMVNVDVEDHRHEHYKAKPTSLKAFKGSGHALGSPVPSVEEHSTSTAASSAAASEAAKKTEETAVSNIDLNRSQPITTLQIRLADGSRLTGQFNLTHTVGDIHAFIQNARPQYANRSFILVSSFPTRELKELESSIEKAGLKNAAVMQRLT